MRIICLSAESADICARLGAWEDVVAVTAFARQDGLEHRPVISGFSTANVDRIAALKPDLVVTFSDVQAGITAELIRSGLTVLATNQRTLAEVSQTIRLIGGAIGRLDAANRLACHFQDELESLRSISSSRPMVYFEEWPEPLISGIAWVSELIELTGGIDVFGARCAKAARDRAVSPEEVVAANPDVILASWCGKSVEPEHIIARSGFEAISAVRNGEIHELDSAVILQPGPRLLEGARQMQRLLDSWRERITATQG